MVWPEAGKAVCHAAFFLLRLHLILDIGELVTKEHQAMFWQD